METKVEINAYSLAVIKSVFMDMQDKGQGEMCDASAWLYNFVKKEGIYPPKIVEGFYSAMEIISDLTAEQFLIIKSVFA